MKNIVSEIDHETNNLPVYKNKINIIAMPPYHNPLF